MVIRMNLSERSYDIVVERGIINSASSHLNLNRKVLIVTDDGVPKKYTAIIAKNCSAPYIYTISQGESSKNFDNYKSILKSLIENNFTRSDCIVAVGGGVVGDLAGFVASTFMRGIDFYNIPTTLLSQIDSSIGGKVAIDFYGFKNIVGAFYQPMKVLIDPDVLKTLPQRQFSSGLAEAIKMSLTCDTELFEMIETENPINIIDDIIIRSLNIKKHIVEQDEKESGLRKVLNFGHTIGHGIESEQEGKLFHGECVALGMLPMCSKEVRDRLLPVLKKSGLPCKVQFSKNRVFNAIKHDKKFKGDTISIVKVNNIGKFEIADVGSDKILELLNYLED